MVCSPAPIRLAASHFAPASADRGTPSPTSLWLVDLPPLAVCSFNSLYSALLAPSMQGRRLLVSSASSLSSFVPVCQRAIFPSLPRAAYLPSALRSGNLPCALLGIEPNACLRLARHAQGRTITKTNHLLMYAITSLCLYNILPPRLIYGSRSLWL